MFAKPRLSSTKLIDEIIDPFGRQINYLRVSVTDRCNFRCQYCVPETGGNPTGKHTQYLEFHEIQQVCRAFIALGTTHIRFTGGEPLLRSRLSEMIAPIHHFEPSVDLSLSTNAFKLDQMADSLYQSGVRRLNISLDSLDNKKFHQITRGGDLSKVLDNIKLAQDFGFFPIKINVVTMKGVNDDEIETLVDWAIDNQLILRFIEVMPIGESGINQMSHLFPAQQILDRIENHVGNKLVPTISKNEGAGPAKYYKLPDQSAEIGVISAVSQHFCETCNRVRLTSRGELALCLGQTDSIDLREPLRKKISDEALQALILEGIKKKPERHFFKENRHNIAFRQMVSLGG